MMDHGEIVPVECRVQGPTAPRGPSVDNLWSRGAVERLAWSGDVR